MNHSLTLPYYYFIRFESLPYELYIGKASQSRERRWSEHSKSFQKGEAAPKMQRHYDDGYRVIYGRITYTLLSLPMQTIEGGEREVMAHAIEAGYTLLNVVSKRMVLQSGRLDRDNAIIHLNTFRSNSNASDE